MASLVQRVLRRFLAKTGGPQVTINGQKYVLSDYWPGFDEIIQELGSGGAKVIGPPEHEDPVSGMLARYKYLWAYDTERLDVSMWRYHDGNPKVHGRAGQLRRELVHLQKKGQLNHVTTNEMAALERWSRGKQRDELESLKRWVEENKTDMERQVDKLVQGWFDREILPRIKTEWAKIERGHRPSDFEANPRLLEFQTEEQQAKMHAAMAIIQKDFSLRKIDEFAADQFGGLDVNDIGGDSQLTYWLRNDIIERFHDRYPT